MQPEGVEHLSVSRLLRVGERIQLLHPADVALQATDFFFVVFEDAALHEVVQPGRISSFRFEQFLFGEFFRQRRIQRLAQIQEMEKQLFLLGRTVEEEESLPQSRV